MLSLLDVINVKKIYFIINKIGRKLELNFKNIKQKLNT